MDGEYQTDACLEPQITMSTCAVTSKAGPSGIGIRPCADTIPVAECDCDCDYDYVPVRSASLFSKPTKKKWGKFRVKNAYHFSHDDLLKYMPEEKDMADLLARVCTFKKWPMQIKQSPLQMAKAGLYYTGVADCCKCFHCNVGLIKWETIDDPLTEHRKHSPDCVFIKMISM